MLDDTFGAQLLPSRVPVLRLEKTFLLKRKIEAFEEQLPSVNGWPAKLGARMQRWGKNAL